MSSLSRIVLVMLLSVSLLLPMVSTALAAIGLSGSERIVICTGNGLQAITLDAEGNPSEPAQGVDEEIPCALVHTVGHVSEPELGCLDFLAVSVEFSRPADCPTSSAGRKSANCPRAPPLL